MPGKDEHETGIFATFTGKAVRRRGGTFMLVWCHTSIVTNTKWWIRDYVVDIEVHVFFLKKTFGRDIELRIKLSYVFLMIFDLRLSIVLTFLIAAYLVCLMI